MSLFDDEDIIMKNAEKLDKFLAAQTWLKEHCVDMLCIPKRIILIYIKKYNTPSLNVYPVTYVVEKKIDNNTQYFPDTQFFTRVELDWKNFKVVLVPRDPNYKLFVRELYDRTPDFIDFSLVTPFKVDKYKVRHE